jgi:EAL and modified HD-GYP domain-containing signal transduction protein
VETEEDFRWASDNGYSLFQGYFFAKPRVSSVIEVSGFKLNYLQILHKICALDLDFAELAAIVEREPGLSYKLLRLSNSALFGRRQPASSVHQAMLRVGENETRKWLSIIVMIDLAADRPSEVMVSALIRARFCELLGSESAVKARTEELFMLGLFSRLDAMFSRSLADLLEDVKLPEDIRKTLIDPASSNTPFSRLWSIVLAYEAGEWNTVSELLAEIDLDSERVHSLYSEAVTWADSTLHRS